MLPFLRSVNRSWLTAKGRALRWYYARRLRLVRGGRPAELTVGWRREPGRAWTLRWRNADDARESLRMFSDANPWLGVPLPAAAKTVVDLGANVGFSTLFWAMKYPAARIVAVEMDAANAERCREIVALNGFHGEVLCTAVSDTDGTLTYRRHGSHSRHALAAIPAAAGAADVGDAVTVEAVTLRTLLDRLGIDRVDLLKIDIEGAETYLLETVTEWAPRVAAMLIELHHNVVEADAVAALLGAGFRIVGEDRASRNELYCERP